MNVRKLEPKPKRNISKSTNKRAMEKKNNFSELRNCYKQKKNCHANSYIQKRMQVFICIEQKDKK